MKDKIALETSDYTDTKQVYFRGLVFSDMFQFSTVKQLKLKDLAACFERITVILCRLPESINMRTKTFPISFPLQHSFLSYLFFKMH